MLLDNQKNYYGQTTCLLTYEEADHWLRATWQGYVEPAAAMNGAQAYLQHAARVPSARLLNDNTQLRGPWFDSLDWLAEVWVPQAARLGLRYVAHVVQADHNLDIIPRQLAAALPFELQIFQDLDEAQQWLRSCTLRSHFTQG